MRLRSIGSKGVFELIRFLLPLIAKIETRLGTEVLLEESRRLLVPVLGLDDVIGVLSLFFEAFLFLFCCLVSGILLMTLITAVWVGVSMGLLLRFLFFLALELFRGFFWGIVVTG